MVVNTERETRYKPKWAWSSVDDPMPYFPKCDLCDAFARWSVGDVGDEVTFADITIRWFACGRHLSRVLDDADWSLDTVTIYDLTYPMERS